MKIYHSIFEFSSPKKTIVTLGTFDGVHYGHSAILNKICQETNENFESVIITFFPHPRLIIDSNDSVKLLNTIDEKAKLLENLGVQNFIIHPFDKTFSELSPREFVEQVLVKTLRVHKIIIGHDHKFGKNRAADFNDLIRFGKEFNFEVEEISAQQINDVSISSTKIRNAILEGNITQANSFLGYNYMLNGVVVKGNQLGRTIDYPTANISINESYKLIPNNGVYIVSVEVENVTYFGMMNIGVKPTLGNNEKSIEVHILNFSKDIYNQSLSVSIFKKIREEQKFQSLNELKNQLEKDKQTTISFFEKLK